MPLVISAPYGNYIQPSGATATLGTFTAKARPGRWLRVAKTVRYYPKIGAWTNQIGLRNPGIECVPDCPDKILSVHGFEDEEWSYLLNQAAFLRPLGIELNLSCPNVPGGDDYPADLFRRAVDSGISIIVKLPPVNYEAMLDASLAAGVCIFHATNTIPTASGGISGKPLKPFAMAVVRAVRVASSTALIIGGGGITTATDIDDFAAAGADRFAIASGSIWAWRLPSLLRAAEAVQS